LSFGDKKLSFHDRSRYRTLAASKHATCGFIAKTHHRWSLGQFAMTDNQYGGGEQRFGPAMTRCVCGRQRHLCTSTSSM
jgi:hypothetical protein